MILAIFQSFGTVDVAKERFSKDVIDGAITYAESLKSFVGIPSKPIALSMFEDLMLDVSITLKLKTFDPTLFEVNKQPGTRWLDAVYKNLSKFFPQFH